MPAHDRGHPRSNLMAVGPHDAPGWLADAARAGGAEIVESDRAETLLWAAVDDPGALRNLLEKCGDRYRWVQLPWAGIEPYREVIDSERIWTCAKGVYAEPVAELALTLMLAAMRSVDRYARSHRWLEHPRSGVNLRGARVTVLGGGGITRALLRLLAPFDAEITVVRNHPAPVPGARRVTGSSDAEVDQALERADAVVLALALTPSTKGLIDSARLGLMGEAAVLVNVARGAHVVTDDLVSALEHATIRGAGLDVTDPEPLPDGHPLWTLPNCIVTPHVGNTPEMARPLLSARITENVRRWIEGTELLGIVDPRQGY